MTSENTPQRAAIYVRLSRDKQGAGIGVARQEADCRELAARLRPPAEVVAVYTDNDITAFKGTRRSKPRPGYNDLLRDLRAGRVDAVLAWHTDRLHRNLTELIDYTDVCKDVPTYTVRGGQLDLSTANGRMTAHILGAVAQQEVEHMIERQRDHKEGVRRAGGRVGGVRPFGYNLDPGGDGLRPNPTEAAVIASAYTKILAGTAANAIAREWNAAGLRTPRKTADPARTGRGTGGVPWNAATVKQVLIRAQNAGLVEYQGQVVGPAKWEPIVTEDTWRAVRALLTDPARRTSPGAVPRYLLTGVLICGVCGSTRFGVVGDYHGAGHYYYACRAYQDRAGIPTSVAGHPNRRQDLLDAYIERIVIERLSQPDVVAAYNTPTVDIAALEAKRGALRARLDELGALFAAGDIDGMQLAAGSKPLREQIERAEAELSEAFRGSALAEFAGVDNVAKVWDSLPIGRQRAIARLLLRVRLHPAGNARPPGWRVGDPVPFDEDSVEILPPDAAPAPDADTVASHQRRREALAERDRKLADLIRANPAMSDNAAAKAVGPDIDHNTAGAVRRRLEKAGEIPVMPRRGHRDAVRRGKVADMLRADPAVPDMAAAKAAGVDKLTAGRVRRELEAAGEIPVVRRKGRGKPVIVTGPTETFRQPAGG